MSGTPAPIALNLTPARAIDLPQAGRDPGPRAMKGGSGVIEDGDSMVSALVRRAAEDEAAAAAQLVTGWEMQAGWPGVEGREVVGESRVTCSGCWEGKSLLHTRKSYGGHRA